MAPRTDLIVGGLLGLLGMGVSLEAVRLTVGSALEPQPGFFPFIGGLLLAALSTLLVARALWSWRSATRDPTGRLGAPAMLVAALTAYVWLLPWAGYPLATALLTLLALRVQRTPWPAAVVTGVLLSLASYFLFLRLGVPLPAGWLLAG